MPSSEAQIKASQRMRKDSGFTDDKIYKCLNCLSDISEALTSVLEGKNTIAAAFRDRKINLLNARRVMYDAGSIYEQESKCYGYGDRLELLAPIEKFYCEIFNCDPRTTEFLEYMPFDAQGTVNNILFNPEKYNIMPREAEIVRLYYFEEMNLEDTGRVIGVTRERARQIIARCMRKLRHPSRSNILRFGLEYEKYMEEEFERRKIELAEELIARKLENDKEIVRMKEEADGKTGIPIEQLELPVRSYNCLKRAGYNTLDDLLEMSEKDLIRIRNIGRNSFDEVCKKIREYCPDWK